MLSRSLPVFVLFVALALGGCGGPDHHDDETGGRRPGERSASIRVINQSWETVFYFYVTPSWEEEWGPDQLGSYVIQPGETFLLHSIRCPETYDLFAEGEYGGVWERNNLRLHCDTTFEWTLVD